MVMPTKVGTAAKRRRTTKFPFIGAYPSKYLGKCQEGLVEFADFYSKTLYPRQPTSTAAAPALTDKGIVTMADQHVAPFLSPTG
jgi:hypothetical protein